MHPADELRELGYDVFSFKNGRHFRIDNVLDFWIGKYGCKWWYRPTDERGHRQPDQIKFLAQTLIGEPRSKGESEWNDTQSKAV